MLKFENITVTFNKKRALDTICATLKAGDFVVIVGPNGAGKSTLMQTIVGSQLPTQGSLWLDNKNITYEPPLKRAPEIARVHQDPLRGTVSDMTVEENLAIACYKGKKVGLQNAFKKWHALQTPETLSSLDQNLLSKTMRANIQSGINVFPNNGIDGK
jgi:putative tryptophan/tyrosine transport system ATP-binding protein